MKPQHYGWTESPPPGAAAADSLGLGDDPDGGQSGQSLPAFVPSEFRPLILAAAARWNVSAALLARPADGRVRLRPQCRLLGRGARDSAVHAQHRGVVRARVRAGA
jgi:hypothetical protein